MDNIIVGDTLEQTYTFDDYSATEYDIWIAIRGQSDIDIKEGESGVTIVKDGDSFVVTVTAAETAAWAIGDYWYQIYMSTTTTRNTVEEGSVTFEQSFSDVTGVIDNRSYVKKVLDAIQAVIEGRASKDQESYSIAGRSLARTPLEDLIKMEDEYRKRYNTEQQEEKIDKGESPGNQIKVYL